MKGAGYDQLWLWFGLSRASFCVMPRVLMHAMPDEWQAKMAALLQEYDATFDTSDLPNCKVMAVGKGERFEKWPEWVLTYRRPDTGEIDRRRMQPCETCGNLAHECPCVDELITATRADMAKNR